jgi:hypothetical protein
MEEWERRQEKEDEKEEEEKKDKVASKAHTWLARLKTNVS